MADEIIKKILKETGVFAEEDIEESAQFVKDYLKAMTAISDLDIMKSNRITTLLKKLQKKDND